MSILMLTAFMLLIVTLFAGIMYIANHTVTELNHEQSPEKNAHKIPVAINNLRH